MSTLLQIEANRRNALKSTGPRSAEGKAASSRNALKSGIDARSTVIRGEDPEALKELTGTYYLECRPATMQEQFCVEILIRNDWQLRRMERVDAQFWEFHLEGYSQPMPDGELGRAWNSASAAFARIQRRKNEIQRSSLLARQELRKLQTEAPAGAPAVDPVESEPSAEIGFVPPEAQTPSSEPDLQPVPPGASPTIGFVPQPGPPPPASRLQSNAHHFGSVAQPLLPRPVHMPRSYELAPSDFCS